MNKIVKNKMEKLIMVVRNDILFDWVKRENKVYLPSEVDFEKRILENYQWMKRWLAEENFDYKQPIPYGILIDNSNKIFVYQRWWKWSNAWEKRLYNNISIGVGGHIEKEDVLNIDAKFNIIENVLLREMEEETNVKSDNIENIQLLGYINNDSDHVSEVHFWILYLVRIKDPSNIVLVDWELASGSFMTLNEAEKVIYSSDNVTEEWSKLAFQRLKQII